MRWLKRRGNSSDIMSTVSIEDRFAISDLFIRYTCALDAGNVDTLVDCTSKRLQVLGDKRTAQALIVSCDPVLGHDQRQPIRVELAQDQVQPGRIDLPAKAVERPA